jgi:DNA invertase Pin-like site-specific DNA recombinase
VDDGEILQGDPDDPMRTALRQMNGVFAELERRMIVKRMREGKRRRRSEDATAYVGGNVPFGFRVQGKHLVPCSQEAPVVEKMLDWHHEGLSLRRIAARPEDDVGAVPTPGGGLE